MTRCPNCFNIQLLYLYSPLFLNYLYCLYFECFLPLTHFASVTSSSSSSTPLFHLVSFFFQLISSLLFIIPFFLFLQFHLFLHSFFCTHFFQFLHLILHQDCLITCSRASPRGRQSSTDISTTRDAYWGNLDAQKKRNRLIRYEILPFVYSLKCTNCIGVCTVCTCAYAYVSIIYCFFSFQSSLYCTTHLSLPLNQSYRPYFFIYPTLTLHIFHFLLLASITFLPLHLCQLGSCVVSEQAEPDGCWRGTQRPYTVWRGTRTALYDTVWCCTVLCYTVNLLYAHSDPFYLSSYPTLPYPTLH